MLRQNNAQIIGDERGSGRLSAIALTATILMASIAPANAAQCRRPGDRQSDRPRCTLTTLPNAATEYEPPDLGQPEGTVGSGTRYR